MTDRRTDPDRSTARSGAALTLGARRRRHGARSLRMDDQTAPAGRARRVDLRRRAPSPRSSSSSRPTSPGASRRSTSPCGSTARRSSVAVWAGAAGDPVRRDGVLRRAGGAHRAPERRARAVGLANGRNPVGIIVPCHRVIGATGSLTGYGGGLDRKRQLLDLERDHGQPRLDIGG